MGRQKPNVTQVETTQPQLIRNSERGERSWLPFPHFSFLPPCIWAVGPSALPCAGAAPPQRPRPKPVTSRRRRTVYAADRSPTSRREAARHTAQCPIVSAALMTPPAADRLTAAVEFCASKGANAVFPGLNRYRTPGRAPNRLQPLQLPRAANMTAAAQIRPHRSRSKRRFRPFRYCKTLRCEAIRHLSAASARIATLDTAVEETRR